MTIFQKMIAVPLLALFLYSGFLYYSYLEYQQTTQNLEEIREQYLPLLEIANENTLLFNQISSSLKDAVLAGEAAWLPLTKQYKVSITSNFKSLEKHDRLVPPKQLVRLQNSFDRYYSNAEKLAQLILTDQDSLIVEGALIQNVETYHNNTEQHFSDLKQSIQRRFREALDDTNKVMNRLLVVGGVMSIAIMLIIITITLVVSISTRRNVYKIIEVMRSFALGSTDFSRRLRREKKDELGYLIHWFNKLSDKLEQDYKTLETVSITDKLTQLNNRSRTDTYLPELLAKAQTDQHHIGVIILDIDHFKSVNDTYGHLVGDEVLKSVAQLMKQQARSHDFLSRWGGEEFIVVIPEATLNEIETFAEGLRQMIFSHDFTEVGKLSASFGAVISNDTDTVTTLLKRADDCLYQAKDNGRNRVVSLA